MKYFTVIASVGGAVLVGLGVVMAIANPSPEAYHEYATKRLTEYVQDQGCEKVPIAKEQCALLVKQAQFQIKEIVVNSTQRQNFVCFSLYKTELSLPFLASYQFETLGVFRNFYTFKLEKQ